MNCIVFLAFLTAFVSLILVPDACQAVADPGCDLEDCSMNCVVLGALRWSCEEEGCLCTFLLDDAKALELGEQVEGEGKDGHKEESPKEKDGSGKGKGSPAKGTGTSNATAAPDQNTNQGRPSKTAGSKKDKKQKDTGQKGLSTTKSPRKNTKKPADGTTEGGSDDEAKLSLVESGEALKAPDNKDASEGDAGKKDMDSISLLSRQALEPDRGGKGKRKSKVRGRKGAESRDMRVPFLVRSLTRELSKKEVMDQIKKQKGDIPMKDIEE